MSKTLALEAYCEKTHLKLRDLGEGDIIGLEFAASAVRKAALREAIEALRKRRWNLEPFGGCQTDREQGAVALAIEGDIEALTRLMGDE